MSTLGKRQTSYVHYFLSFHLSLLDVLNLCCQSMNTENGLTRKVRNVVVVDGEGKIISSSTDGPRYQPFFCFRLKMAGLPTLPFSSLFILDVVTYITTELNFV
jgi:hypothetical protein